MLITRTLYNAHEYLIVTGDQALIFELPSLTPVTDPIQMAVIGKGDMTTLWSDDPATVPVRIDQLRAVMSAARAINEALAEIAAGAG